MTYTAPSGKKRCTTFRECDEPRVCSSSGYCECPFTMSETSTGICVYRNNQGSRSIASSSKHLLVPPGSYCDGTTALCSPASECVNHRCACPSGYSEQAGTCRRSLTGTNTPSLTARSPSVAPGAACLPGDSCVPGASCVLGVCQCENGALPDNTACRLINRRGLPPSPLR